MRGTVRGRWAIAAVCAALAVGAAGCGGGAGADGSGSATSADEPYEDPYAQTAPYEEPEETGIGEDDVAEIRQLLTDLIVLKRYDDGSGSPASPEAFIEACDTMLTDEAAEQIVEVVKSPAQDCPTAFRDYNFLPYGPDFGGLSGVPSISEEERADEVLLRNRMELAGLRVWENGEGWGLASLYDGKVSFRVARTVSGQWRIGDVRPYISGNYTDTATVFSETLKACMENDPVYGEYVVHLPQGTVDVGSERFEPIVFQTGETIHGGGDSVSVYPAGTPEHARYSMINSGFGDVETIQADPDHGEVVRRGAVIVHREEFVRPLADDPVIQAVDRCGDEADQTAASTRPDEDTVELARIERLYR